MAKKIVPDNQHQQGLTSVCVPRYRLKVVKEHHSPLYGAPTMSDSDAVSRLLRTHFEGRPHEEFLVVFLDAKHTPVGYQVVSVGPLTVSIVHSREALKAAVCMNAAAVIFRIPYVVHHINCGYDCRECCLLDLSYDDGHVGEERFCF